MGFLHLVEHLDPRRCYIAETATPHMHKVQDFLVARVESADAVSFTMKSGVSLSLIESFLSLTAHWIDAGFTVRRACYVHPRFTYFWYRK